MIPVGGRVDRRQLQNTARLLRSVVEEGCGEVRLATQSTQLMPLQMASAVGERASALQQTTVARLTRERGGLLPRHSWGSLPSLQSPGTVGKTLAHPPDKVRCYPQKCPKVYHKCCYKNCTLFYIILRGSLKLIDK